MTSLDDAIEEWKRIVDGKITEAKTAAKKFDKLIELQKIKNKRLKGEKLSEEDIRKAQGLLCWGNFAGCCSWVKDCPWHKSVCDALGIDPKELYDAKKKAVEKHLKKLGINV